MRDKSKPILLLDRDGTLITEQEYLKDPGKVRLLPGVAPALKRLLRAGFPLVVITNQSGVGRGWISARDVKHVNKRLESLLRQRGVRLDGIYWCPHKPSQGCACRKPKLKLVKQAARALGRTWRGSLSIGDKWSDVELGQNTGGQGVLVLTGYGRQTQSKKAGHRRPVAIARNFAGAARWILKNHTKESKV